MDTTTGQPVFTVLGTHTYTRKGTLPLKVAIKDKGGATLTVINQVIVS